MLLKHLFFSLAVILFAAPAFSDEPDISKEECVELREDIFGLMATSDYFFKDIEKHKEGSRKYEKAWEGAIMFSRLSADWSTVYDVWCKDN